MSCYQGNSYARKSTTQGYYTKLFLVPKPMKRWRPGDLSILNSHLHVLIFKMETAEYIRKSIRAYFDVPIHPQSQKYLRFKKKKGGGGGVPILATPFFGVATAPLEFTCIVKEVKLIAQARNLRIHQYLDDWLLRSPTKEQCLKDSENLVKLVQEQGWLINFQKSELVPTEGSGLSNPKETPSVKSSDCFHQKVICLDSKKAHVTHRDISFLRKNSTTGKVTHETFPVVPKVTLEISPVTGQKDPSNREFFESSQMVGESTESYGRCSYTSSYSQHTGIHRCPPKRLGSSLKRNSSQWPLVKQGGSASHQCIGAKICSPSPKGVSGALARSKTAHLFRQQYSSILSEQKRRHTFHRNVCSYLENSGIHKFQKNPDKSKTCTWIPKCDSRLPITKGQGHTNRVVPSPTDIPTKFAEFGTHQW